MAQVQNRLGIGKRLGAGLLARAFRELTICGGRLSSTCYTSSKDLLKLNAVKIIYSAKKKKTKPVRNNPNEWSL